MKSNKLTIVAGLLLISAGIKAEQTWMEWLQGQGSQVATAAQNNPVLAGVGFAIPATLVAAWKLYFENKAVTEALQILKREDKEAVTKFVNAHPNMVLNHSLNALKTNYPDNNREIYEKEMQDLSTHKVHKLAAKAFRNKGKTGLAAAALMALAAFGLKVAYDNQ